LLTAHVARPNEHGPGRGEAAPTVAVDIAVKNLEELAGKLGVLGAFPLIPAERGNPEK
jgi:2-haloacid dehalogenase